MWFICNTNFWCLVPGSDLRNGHIWGELYFPNINVGSVNVFFSPPEKCLCVQWQRYESIPNFIAGVTKHRTEHNPDGFMEPRTTRIIYGGCRVTVSPDNFQMCHMSSQQDGHKGSRYRIPVQSGFPSGQQNPLPNSSPWLGKRVQCPHTELKYFVNSRGIHACSELSTC